MPDRFEILHKDLAGRIGRLSTPHGTIETPALMPVVNPHLRIIEPAKLAEMGADMIITNSYIIHQDPELKRQAIERGLHDLLGFSGPIMTDSGAFQLSVYGIEVAPKELVDYWLDEYDWRKEEARLNSFAHFKADVDGLGIHFIHQEGKGPDPMPLFMMHGYPWSFTMLLRIIPMLTDPAAHGSDTADAFTVVVPSLIGFGLSDAPPRLGFGFQHHPDKYDRLMTEGLGYPRYGIEGGDWGGFITAPYGFLRPDNLIGIHLNFLFPRVADERPPEVQFTYSKVNPVPVKSLARVLGLPAGELRRPYLDLTGRALRNGVAIVEGLGLAARYGFQVRDDLIGADQPAPAQIAEPASEAPGTGSGACFIR